MHLRNFTYSNINILQAHGYDKYARDEMRAIIGEWDKKFITASTLKCLLSGIRILCSAVRPCKGTCKISSVVLHNS